MINLPSETINAVARGDEPSLASFLKETPELINARGPHGETLLHLVIDNFPNLTYAAQLAQLLIDSGADVNASDNAGRRPIQDALGHHDLVCTLLKAGAATDLYDENHFNMSLAEISLYHQWIDIATMLVEHGAPVDLRIEAGLGKTDAMCQRVGQHGGFRYSSIGLPGQSGPKLSINDGLRQALAYAVRNGQIEAVNLLIDEGAPVNDIVPHLGKGYAPLHHAAECNQLEAIKVLIDHGAHPETFDQTEKLKPMEIAQQLGFNDIVIYLNVLTTV